MVPDQRTLESGLGVSKKIKKLIKQKNNQFFHFFYSINGIEPN